MSWCLACSRAAAKRAQRKRSRERPDELEDQRLRRQFGISLEDYDERYRQQMGRCAVCSTERPVRGRGRLRVDHDHVTGAVRGLLCHRCNIGIGQFQESAVLLKRAVQYLEGGP
ncbi:MAG: endonuclease VII domain-containing protein [Chloroflexi bacterium]|nr:endonuclease VII domain-containing protein [Chloroflexota bacterium]